MNLSELSDRTEILDALYRFGLGQDRLDRDLFASSFAPDATLDFRPTAEKLGFASDVMTGRDTIVDIILGLFTGRVQTSHTITNPRIQITGDTARGTVLVEAQHVLTADETQHALLKNLYDVTFVRDGSRWLIQDLEIFNLWHAGDPKAIFS